MKALIIKAQYNPEAERYTLDRYRVPHDDGVRRNDLQTIMSVLQSMHRIPEQYWLFGDGSCIAMGDGSLLKLP